MVTKTCLIKDLQLPHIVITLLDKIRTTFCTHINSATFNPILKYEIHISAELPSRSGLSNNSNDSNNNIITITTSSNNQQQTVFRSGFDRGRRPGSRRLRRPD